MRLVPVAIAVVTLSCTLAVSSAQAQSAAAIRSTVEKALASNPEVAARYHAFRAASDGVDAAKAGRGPRLDLTGDIGRDQDTFTGGSRQSLNRSGLGLQLSQVLWDGLGARHEVDRNNHERLSRYFELLDTSEQTALEAARALYDVERFRRLVALAEDNVVQHRLAAEKISSRVRAGVGRGVDAEQSNARLALAESNLATEVANLHDVSARYQRIVGEAPPPAFNALSALEAGLPKTAGEALAVALARNPSVSAAVESLRASRAAVKTREALLQPRVEARVRTAGGNNVNGLDGRRTDSAAEVVMSWNLFDGGADRARVRQQANLVGQAMDLRDKACRDARQTTLIAFNDTVKLADQIGLLERNTQAIERARDAYRQQFDIGQRSLLDLLNAENETYTARRALTNAQFDRAVALARTHAALNQLNAQLGLARGGQADEAAGWTAGSDGAGRCPAQAIDVAATDPAALARRATAAAAPAAVPAAVTPAVVAVAPPAPPAPAAAAAAPALNPADAAARVDGWAAAWRGKDFAGYQSFYAPDFKGSEPSRAAWENKRRRMLGKPGEIGLTIDGMQTQLLPDGSVQTRFRQAYRSSNFRDTSTKVLTWRSIGGQWLIVQESNR